MDQAPTTDPAASSSPPRLTGANIWACKVCKARLALNQDLVSKKFVGRNGKAYLFTDVSNIRIGEPENSRLLTGMHDISQVSCEHCDTYLGWKYIAAAEYEQRYKVGHVLLVR